MKIMFMIKTRSLEQLKRKRIDLSFMLSYATDTFFKILNDLSIARLMGFYSHIADGIWETSTQQ